MAAGPSASDFNPLPGPLGVNQRFLFQEPSVLVIKEKFSFSGDDFAIKTIQGMDVVHCKGQVVSLSGRKQFSTPDGQPLFQLRREHFSFPKSWYLEGPNGEKFCVLKGRFSLGKAKLDVQFKNVVGKGEDIVLEVRGQFFDRSADITWNGQPIAKIRRDFFNMREIFGDKQTYGVEVAPGVDLALIAAVVVGIDEQRNEK